VDLMCAYVNRLVCIGWSCT